MGTYINDLIDRALVYVEMEMPVPIDIIARLDEAGIDITALA